MKIRITAHVPVKEKHGIRVGRVFPTVQPYGKTGTWVKGDTGEPVRLFPHEFEVVT